MRISELSARSGAPIPTLKFYLRERLLPPGTPTGGRQAEYDERHLARVRLIHALTDVGRMRLRDVRRVLDAIDDTGRPLHEALGAAQYALASPPAHGGDDPSASAIAGELVHALRWRVRPDSPARGALEHAISRLMAAGWPVDRDELLRYGRAADALAPEEVAAVRRRTTREEAVERMVVGTVIFDAILSALRRMAQESHSADSR